MQKDTHTLSIIVEGVPHAVTLNEQGTGGSVEHRSIGKLRPDRYNRCKRSSIDWSYRFEASDEAKGEVPSGTTPKRECPDSGQRRYSNPRCQGDLTVGIEGSNTLPAEPLSASLALSDLDVSPMVSGTLPAARF